MTEHNNKTIKYALEPAAEATFTPAPYGFNLAEAADIQTIIIQSKLSSNVG